MPDDTRPTASWPPPGPRPAAGTQARLRIPVPRRAEEQGVVAPGPAAAARAPLSQRDLVLLRHLADGGSIAQVASALSVSRNTARTRIRRVAAKLAVPDRARLARAARDLDLDLV